jgi:hypothetical protein
METAHSACKVGTEYANVQKVTVQLTYLFILFCPHIMTWRPCVAVNLNEYPCRKNTESLILLLLIVCSATLTEADVSNYSAEVRL